MSSGPRYIAAWCKSEPVTLGWVQGMNYVDLIAILPYYIDVIMLIITGDSGGADLSFLRYCLLNLVVD